MITHHQKLKDVKRNWHLIDAGGNILGRMATEVSTLLTGKRKVDYSPHLDNGDYVVVVNAKDVKLTGLKMQNKVYRRHSGYPGGLKEVSFQEQLKKDPRKIILHAVSGMLAGNRLKDKRLKRLKVFSGSEHPYSDKFTSKN